MSTANGSPARPALDAEQAKAAIEQARASLKSGDVDGAAAALRKVGTRLEAPPAELADAAKVMADAGSPVDAVARYLEAGRGFLDAHDAARARQCFVSAYEIDGKNMDALFELGRADVAEGKKHEALDKFVEVLRKANLKHLPALYEAGCLYEQDGQHNQAILAFNRVVERDKTNFSAFEHLGALYQIRNQQNDAAANYVRGAEAALAKSQYGDAKRLAEAALAIDSSNTAARRTLGAAEASANAPGQTSAPSAPAAAPAPSPAPSPGAAQHTTIADVTPLAPPLAEGTPPPSMMNVSLPPDLALLEQQSQAMAQLAQVQSAVAQTYRQRLALEEEIKKAQAALEALQHQQQSVDEDLSGKRDEFEKVVAAREAEEASLASLGDAISKSKAELDALASLPALIADVRTKCTSTSELAGKASDDVDAVASGTNEVMSKASAADAALADLRAKLAAVRQAADAIESQIAALDANARDAHAVAKDAAAGAEQAKASVARLRERQAALDKSHLELADVANVVNAKRAEAEQALGRLQALQAQRKSQFDEIVFNVTPLVGDVQPAKAEVKAKVPAPATRSAAPQPAAQPPPAPPRNVATSAPASVEALIAAGKFSEAVQRAQTDANAKPKPAEYLVDVGVQVRKAGRLQDAVSLFSSARDRDQHSARARYELGRTLAEIGKADDALAALQPLESDPQYAVLGNVAIGKCLRSQGDIEAAEARFSQALEIEGHADGEYHEALYQLADLHESKGDPESLGLALWSWEELQTGDPNYGDVAQRVARLKARLSDGARAELAHNGAVKQ
jgi:tetratricopeptide (TPR) repeat protein